MKAKKTPTIGEIKQRIRDMRSSNQKRKNADGSVSTHKMSYEGSDEEGYYVYPTIFPNEDGSWTDYLGEEESDDNWEKTYQEAKRRGEVIAVPSKQLAEDLAGGSWKPAVKLKKKYKKGGIFPPKIQQMKNNLEPAIYDGMLDEVTVTPYTQSEYAFRETFPTMGRGEEWVKYKEKEQALKPVYPIFDILTGLRITRSGAKNLLRLKGTELNKIYRQVGKDGLKDALKKGKIFDKGQEQLLKNNPSLNYTKEAEKFLNSENLSLLEKAQMGKPSSAPFFSKDKLFFKEGFKKGSGKTRDSSTDYLFASKKRIGNEALIPKYRDAYLKEFSNKKPVGVLKPEYNDLSNFKVYKKGKDGEYYRMILKELAQKFKK